MAQQTIKKMKPNVYSNVLMHEHLRDNSFSRRHVDRAVRQQPKVSISICYKLTSKVFTMHTVLKKVSITICFSIRLVQGQKLFYAIEQTSLD